MPKNESLRLTVQNCQQPKNGTSILILFVGDFFIFYFLLKHGNVVMDSLFMFLLCVFIKFINFNCVLVLLQT